MEFQEMKHLVYTRDLTDLSLVRQLMAGNVQCHPVLDARSAVYVGTGIAAESRELVVVCVAGSNSSRSAFSGMTEAFYRNLPIVLVTLGDGLDYSVQLRDVMQAHITLEDPEDMQKYFHAPYPVHIEVKGDCSSKPSADSRIISALQGILNSDDYLYLSRAVSHDAQGFACKVVKGGMPGCYEGAVANVLGASLAKLHKRYIGVLSEEEFFHDMNTLGNIHVNDALVYIVIARRADKLIEDYAASLGFCVETLFEDAPDANQLQAILGRRKKTLILAAQEK